MLPIKRKLDATYFQFKKPFFGGKSKTLSNMCFSKKKKKRVYLLFALIF